MNENPFGAPRTGSINNYNNQSNQGSRQPMDIAVRTILQHVGLVLQSNPKMRLTELLLEHDITRTGLLSRADFESIMKNRLTLTRD